MAIRRKDAACIVPESGTHGFTTRVTSMAKTFLAKDRE